MYLTRRQKQILDFLENFIANEGYSPSLEEVGRHFGLKSLATVHKHLRNLEEKNLIKRRWKSSRSIELVPQELSIEAVELPLMGTVAAGEPIEAIRTHETIAVPPDMVGRGRTYVLRVRGTSMIDEQIRDGDYVVVEEARDALNGQTVIALLRGEEVTLKKLFRENGMVRLQPANPELKPIMVPADQVTVQGLVIGVIRKLA